MTRKKGIRTILIIVACALILFEIIFERRTDEFMVFFLDVGQGESTLIRSPEGMYILVDTGPGHDALEELGKYFPISQSKIDLLILSHFDKDHVGGLEQLLQTYNVASVVYNELDPDLNQNYLSQLKAISKIDSDFDSSLKLGCCLVLNWLHVAEQKQDSNAQSIAFRLDFQDLNMFFGGDLPSDVEDRLGSKIGDIEVLKVSHHGSKTSTSTMFLNSISPEYAIISVGINNGYGHPHQQVIDNLVSSKIGIMRTDLHGTQVLIASGTQFEMVSTDKCQYYCMYRLYLRKYLP